MSNLEDRVSNNLIYYRMNYLALYVCMLVIIAYILFFSLFMQRMSSPFFAMLDFCIALLWL